MGSPPLTWRTLDLNDDVTPKNGITSTYVENTIAPREDSFVTKDHLHLRGEHLLLRLRFLCSRGSPPLTWRTLKDPYNKAIL